MNLAGLNVSGSVQYFGSKLTEYRSGMTIDFRGILYPCSSVSFDVLCGTERGTINTINRSELNNFLHQYVTE